jgi:hypothetical protein
VPQDKEITLAIKQIPIAPKWIKRRIDRFQKVRLFQLGGRAIATPCPPCRLALALVKLLPLAPMFGGVDGRSAVDPDLGGFDGSGAAGGTAKGVSVDGGLSPVGGIWGEGFHEGKGEEEHLYGTGLYGTEFGERVTRVKF